MKKLAAVALMLACAAPVSAEPFPAKPVRLIVPNPAGGTVEILGRTVAHSMAPSLGQPVVVELKPGGDTIIGTDAAARSAPDGHTLLLVGTSFAFNPLVRKLPYDTSRDFTPVARLATLPLLIAVHPSVPATTLKELVGLAKAKPGELDYAAFATARLAGEMFKSYAGVDMRQIPYQGGVQATTAVVGGHVKVLAGPLSDAAPHVAAGRLRPLAVTSLERSEAMKAVPTVAESGYAGFEFVNWIGIVAPAGTPAAVVERISAEAKTALDLPEARAALARLGVAPAYLPPARFGEMLRTETAKFDALVKQTGYRVD